MDFFLIILVQDRSLINSTSFLHDHLPSTNIAYQLINKYVNDFIEKKRIDASVVWIWKLQTNKI